MQNAKNVSLKLSRNVFKIFHKMALLQIKILERDKTFSQKKVILEGAK